MSSPDWTSLPTELVHLIVEKLILLQDYIRFCAVCKQWSSNGQDHKLQRMKTSTCSQPPMLLLPDISTSPATHNMYNFIGKTYVDSRLRCDERFIGSSFGWLISVLENGAIFLMNPFSCRTIELPPISRVSDLFFDDGNRVMENLFFTQRLFDSSVSKIILSDDPSLNPHNYIVVAICKSFSTVAFMRSGDESWTYFNEESLLLIDDILFYKDRLYAVDCYNGLTKINLKKDGGDHNMEILVSEYPVDQLDFMKSYLVESVDGELLLIRRLYRDRIAKGKRYTKGFQVLKLVKEKELMCWTQIERLGRNQSFYLGYNDSLSILADNFSPYIQRNSIYYTDDCKQHCDRIRYDDMGIFDFENQNLHSFYDPVNCSARPSCHAHDRFLTAIWISPSLQ